MHNTNTTHRHTRTRTHQHTVTQSSWMRQRKWRKTWFIFMCSTSQGAQGAPFFGRRGWAWQVAIHTSGTCVMTRHTHKHTLIHALWRTWMLRSFHIAYTQSYSWLVVFDSISLFVSLTLSLFLCVSLFIWLSSFSVCSCRLLYFLYSLHTHYDSVLLFSFFFSTSLCFTHFHSPCPSISQNCSVFIFISLSSPLSLSFYSPGSIYISRSPFSTLLSSVFPFSHSTFFIFLYLSRNFHCLLLLILFQSLN